MKQGESMEFNKTQIEFLNKIGISTVYFYELLEERVSEYLQKYGFNANYEPTEEGRICESILDILSE